MLKPLPSNPFIFSFLLWFMSVSSDRVVFLEDVHGTYNLVATRKLSKNKDVVRYKKSSYIVDRSIPSYVQSGKTFYYFVVGQGQVSFSKTTFPIPLETVDDLFTSEVIRQCVSRLDVGSSPIGPILYLAIGAALGVFAGFGIAGMI
jgi:hypothetical protein